MPAIRQKAMTGSALMLLLGAATAHRSVPISSVEALTLQSGRMTTGRRTAPINQLSCRGANCMFAPSSVRCTNAGFDGTDVQWDCKAELDDRVRFGSMNVQCEGYEYPSDPNILAGSCGLEYTLESTGRFYQVPRAQHSDSGDSLLGGILTLVLLFAAVSACGSSSSHSYNNGGCYRSSYGSGPGFWTGAAAGALGASAFRNRSYHSGGGWSTSSGGGWGGGSHSSTGYASTSRR